MIIFRGLAALALLSLVWTAGVWLTGGFTIEVAGVRMASTTVWRPLILTAVTTLALFVIYGPRRVVSSSRDLAARVGPGHLMTAIALAAALAGVRWGTWTASGPDPFAYVSQAAMFREGMWTVPVPLAGSAPWPQPVETFTPFGYRAALDRSPALVPMTTPGLPLAMAATQAVLGHWSAFLITPVAAAALIAFTFGIGKRVRSAAAGVIAAWLMATSPVLLFMVMWPMTDIPAAACAAAMIYWLLSRSTRGAAAAGLIAAAGLLLRPTFALIAAGAIAWLVLETVKRRSAERAGPEGPAYVRILAFLFALLPGIALLLYVNNRWFDSPLTFGYGAPGQLLVVSRLGTNLARYARWIVETSPLALVGLLMLIAVVVRPALAGIDRRSAALLAIVGAAACGPYLLYEPFSEWWYLRFLLPAWPVLFLGVGLLCDALRQRGRAMAAVIALVVLVAGAAGIAIAERRGVFQLNERRYATIARIVTGMTDPSAVILTVQHSGTIRYYAGRQTLRWDLLDQAWLDRSIAWLAEQGRHPYLLIEDWEQQAFETRFSGAHQFGRLSYSPLMAWQSVRADGWIYLFDPLTRDAATRTPGPDVELAEPFTAPPAAQPWPR